MDLYERLLDLSDKSLAQGKHCRCILVEFPRLLQLRPNDTRSVNLVRWMADHAFSHTGDAALQLRYMDLALKVTCHDRMENLNRTLQRGAFKLQQSLWSSMEEYDTEVQDLHDVARKWSAPELDSLLVNTKPMSTFVSMMLLEPTCFQALSQACLRRSGLPAPAYDHQVGSLSKKVGFLWLGIDEDPSFRCLASFVNRLAGSRDVCIFFDSKSLSKEQRQRVGNARVKCVKELSDKEVAALIYDERIEVLINNYFDRTRGFEVLALRPAPCVINFMGTPGRYLARNLIDYAATDVHMHRHVDKMPDREASIIFPLYPQVVFPTTQFINRSSAVSTVGMFMRPAKVTPHEASFILRLLRSTNVTFIAITSKEDAGTITDVLLRCGVLPEPRVKVRYEFNETAFYKMLSDINIIVDTFSHWGCADDGA